MPTNQSNPDVVTHNPKWKGDPVSYIKSKLHILEHDFYIKPTEEELKKLNQLDTQIRIDNYIWSIIDSRY